MWLLSLVFLAAVSVVLRAVLVVAAPGPRTQGPRARRTREGPRKPQEGPGKAWGRPSEARGEPREPQSPGSAQGEPRGCSCLVEKFYYAKDKLGLWSAQGLVLGEELVPTEPCPAEEARVKSKLFLAKQSKVHSEQNYSLLSGTRKSPRKLFPALSNEEESKKSYSTTYFSSFSPCTD